MEKISEGKSRRIPITFPIEVFDVFDDFSKAKANHCYWLAIKLLLEEYKKQEVMDSKTMLLIERDNQLASELTKLTQRIEDIEENLLPKKNEKKHFGKKEKEDKENEE